MISLGGFFVRLINNENNGLLLVYLHDNTRTYVSLTTSECDTSDQIPLHTFWDDLTLVCRKYPPVIGSPKTSFSVRAAVISCASLANRISWHISAR